MPKTYLLGRTTEERGTAIRSAREQELRKRSELEGARQELRESLEAGREAGMTLQELADLVGLTRQRVHELLS